MTIIWIKPSGIEMRSNDLPETIEYLESLNYKRKGEKKQPAQSKKKTSKKSHRK